MVANLRSLDAKPARFKSSRTSMNGLFWCGVLAVVLQLTFSANILHLLGYTSNIHPATVLVTICLIYAVARGNIPLHLRFRDAPALILFVIGIPAIALYSIYFVGFSGATVFVESFWSAGILALLLEQATVRQKRLLGGILIALVVCNVFVALYESVVQIELFPPVYDAGAVDSYNEMVDDFRAHAFYGHPLNASLITSMAIFMLYNTRMKLVFSLPLVGLLLLGLFAFGGRTALGVTVVGTAGAAVYVLLSGLAQRKLRLDFVLALLGAVLIVVPVLTLIVTQTTIADRVIHNMYYDGSAEVRVTQWDIFGHLDLNDWLFGISKERFGNLKYQIGLGGKDTDVENFWILVFLDLGVIGFTVFVTLFGGFLVHLARYANTLNGWLLVGSALVIDSSSNSLGVWSNDLFIEVAFVIAIAGYRERSLIRQLRPIRMKMPDMLRPSRAQAGLSLSPQSSRMFSLRRLT